MIVTFVLLAFYLFFMIYPMISLVKQSFMDKETGVFSMVNYMEFFNNKSNVLALQHSFKISVWVTVFSLILGVPLAYFTTCYKIKGSKLLRVLVILSSMSPPFVGAFSWVVFCGNNGVFTRFMRNVFNIEMPSIYGFNGIVLVMSLSFLSLVYLYVSGALKNIDNSLVEASSNLGTTGIKRFLKVIIPLIMPTMLASALMVFMRAFADFGTPVFIGKGYQVFTVLIYDQYSGEMSQNKAYAAALSVIAIIITTVIFLLQKWANSKFTFTMNALHPIEQKKAKPLQNVLMHLYCYFITLLAFLPQIYVIFTSFQRTSESGLIFKKGFSLNSYRYVLEAYSDTIWNTIKIAVTALLLVVLLAVVCAYLVVRRKNIMNQALDILTMMPYIIPGSVIGVALIVCFNKSIMGLPVLTGGPFIMIVALIIRRSPYTIRSSVAILQQIPQTIEEASISLGSSKAKTFFKVTLPMMLNGVISGAILSWVSIITELSTAIYLFTYRTRTMTISVYELVTKGSYGYASAMAAILTLFTTISLILYMVVTKGEGSGTA
ncbi:MAG: iron ABC transporter permease [Erysipelotrichaceae bacterium]|nr:iron ABC transporter permease [Erysipelotrichaceae bacterium]